MPHFSVLEIGIRVTLQLRRLYLSTRFVNAFFIIRGGYWTAATFKMELFVIIVNGWKLLTIITKLSILYVAAVLDPPLIMGNE